MVRPRSHALAEDEIKHKPPKPWASSDSSDCVVTVSGSPQGGKLFHMVSALLPSSNQLCDSCLHCFWLYFGVPDVAELAITPPLLKWLLCISQRETQYYKLTYKNGLLPSLSAFINYVQKYFKVVANSLDCDSDCIKDK